MDEAGTAPPSVVQRTALVLRAHSLFAALFAAGVFVRAFAWAWAWPILWFNGDSQTYVYGGLHPSPSPWRPAGYSFLLGVLSPAHSFAFVSAVQHLLGLAVGLLTYTTLLRLGVRRWLAALAAGPVLLDAYTVVVEQTVLSEALFDLLVVAALCLLADPQWARRWPLAAVAGGLLGYAAITRTIGLPVAVVTLGVLAIARAGWRPVAAFCAVAAALVIGYAGWFHSNTGHFGLEASDGLFLYGRTSAFADCSRMHVAANSSLGALCLDPAHRPTELASVFSPRSPLRHAGPTVVAENGPARRFALKAIEEQPGGYAKVVWQTLASELGPHRGGLNRLYDYDHYQIVSRSAQSIADEYDSSFPRGGVSRAGWGVRAGMRYQRVLWVPGLLCVLGLLVAAAGALVPFPKAPAPEADADEAPARHEPSARVAWMFLGPALVLTLVPPLTVVADARYRVPIIAVTALAAAVGLERLLRRGSLALSQRSARRVALVAGQ